MLHETLFRKGKTYNDGRFGSARLGSILCAVEERRFFKLKSLMKKSQKMTAEDIKEEATESGVESDSFAQSNAKRDSVIEGEGDWRNSEVGIPLANPTSQLEESLEDEEVELEKGDTVENGGEIEQRGSADLNGGDREERIGGDEEGCPFCLYMKAGACGEHFTNWEECINEGEKAGEDVVEKCVRVTRLLTQCMRANADYYGSVLEAEKAMATSIANASDGLDDASKEKAEHKDSDEIRETQNAPRKAEE